MLDLWSKTGNSENPLSYARVNDIDLYYETCGPHSPREPLVLLHGFSGTGRAHWHLQIPIFAERYRVILPDLRGHGKSKCQTVPPDYWELLASDIAALISLLGLGQVHICGFSLGSVVAQLVALDHPDLVQSLVLVSTAAHIPVESQGLLAFFESLTRPDEIDAEWKESLIEMHGDPDWRWLLKNYGLMAVTRVKGGGGEVTRHRLGEIACPTLIVQGQRDRMNPPELAKVVHQGVHGSEMSVFPCGHIVQEAEAERFNQLVLRFLDGLSQKREGHLSIMR
jgi:pimeloyl-ACP methyl ester carboxylesterase